jgi:copper homeostasis protein
VTRVLVEVAVDSLDGADAAAQGGADRIELCAALHDGGLTPGPGLLELALQRRLPVMAMARPRPGDFLYTAAEFATLLRDVAAIKAAGAAGVVSGVLRQDAGVDRERMREVLAMAAPLPVTFHRAFDLCPDAEAALQELIELGVSRVLTSGQAASAPLGSTLIARLVQRAQGRIAVVAGAGVRPDSVVALVRATGVGEVHLSASTWTPSRMRWHRPGIAMGQGARERENRATDPATVAAVVAALRPVTGNRTG